MMEGWSDKGLMGHVGDRSIARRATRKFTVLVDSAEDSPQVAEQAWGIPVYGEGYPGEPWLKVTDKDVKTKSPTLFEVTVTYEQEVGSDPTAEDPDVAWDFVETHEEVDTDVDDKPLVNVNQEGFDPPITREFADLVLTITRNEPAFNPILADQYKTTINSEPFYGFAAQTVLLKKITGQAVKTNNVIDYWRVAYIFHIRTDGWRRRILNRGFKVRATDENGVPLTPPEYKTATGHDGNPLNEPVLLTENGLEKSEEDEPHWLKFRLYEEKSFGPLGLA